MNTYSSAIIRYAICLMFLWFGYQQLIDPAIWVSYLPEFTGYLPIPGEMLVQLNGWFEIIFSLLLFLGVYTRFVSGVLGLHLLGIAYTAGGAIGIRDLALGIVTLAISTSPPDDWTIDKHAKKVKTIKTAH